MSELEPMTQAEYARHRGVSRQMIGKLVAGKKIPPDAFVGDGMNRRIDPVKADFALGASRERVNSRDEDAAADQEDLDEGDASFGSDAAPRQSQALSGLTAARTHVATYEAGIKKLDFEQRLGKVRPVEEIAAAATKCGGVIVQALEAKLLRVEDLTVAATREGEFGVRKLLKTIIREERDAINIAFAALGAESIQAAAAAEEQAQAS